MWALGDCALVPDRNTGTYYPPMAQHTLREGKVLARNIAGGRDASAAPEPMAMPQAPELAPAEP